MHLSVQQSRMLQSVKTLAYYVQAVARACKARKQVHEMRVLAPLLHLCLHKKAALVQARYNLKAFL